MKKQTQTTMTASGLDQRSALASPLRLEILGLFIAGDPLAISDMAALMGRSAGSLYHHVGILEKAGLLKRTGTRPKGKRYEALFLPAADRIQMEAHGPEGDGAHLAVKTMAAAFRMAERDLEAGLQEGTCVTEGPGRTLYATRMHMRASPQVLAKINKHFQAIEDLLAADAAKDTRLSPDDHHLSLTLALLPLKGRGHADKE
jgi:DNA-binding transcriptional ArsR family regulator